jgi:hypothetical protein
MLASLLDTIGSFRIHPKTYQNIRAEVCLGTLHLLSEVAQRHSYPIFVLIAAAMVSAKAFIRLSSRPSIITRAILSVPE